VGSVSKRALVLTVCCATLVTSSARAANAAEASVDIRKVDSSSFPEVTVTVAVKAADQLTEDDLQLAVGGSAVEDVELRSLAESGQQVDVVLVIDTSGSMEGEALASAVAAALRFVTTLPDEIRVGILTFSDQARVLQPITENHSEALESLGRLKARGETALYDALGSAARMFSGPAQRNIVLLSDGGDTASQSGLKSATAAARAAGATVYAVGLDTPETDVASLRSIAQATAGRYSPAAAARLATIYQGLATELSNQYLVSYQSSRKWHGQVTLSVSAFGVADTALVLFPKIEAPPPPSQPSAEPEGVPLLAKGWGLAVVLGLCFAAVFAIMLMLLGAGVRTRRDRELAKRMAAGASVPVPHDVRRTDERNIASWIPHVFVRAGNSLADAGGFGTELDSKLERAGLPLRAGEFIAGTAVVAVVGAMLGTLLFGALVPGLLLAGIAAAIPSILLAIAVRRRVARLHGQLADVLMILASSLRSGHSFFQALDMVAKEIGDPTRPSPRRGDERARRPNRERRLQVGRSCGQHPAGSRRKPRGGSRHSRRHCARARHHPSSDRRVDGRGQAVGGGSHRPPDRGRPVHLEGQPQLHEPAVQYPDRTGHDRGRHRLADDRDHVDEEGREDRCLACICPLLWSLPSAPSRWAA
jgi:tight adherence protein B